MHGGLSDIRDPAGSEVNFAVVAQRNLWYSGIGQKKRAYKKPLISLLIEMTKEVNGFYAFRERNL